MPRSAQKKSRYSEDGEREERKQKKKGFIQQTTQGLKYFFMSPFIGVGNVISYGYRICSSWNEPSKFSDLFKNEKDLVRTISRLKYKMEVLEEEMKLVKTEAAILFKKKNLISALSRLDLAHFEGLKLSSPNKNASLTNTYNSMSASKKRNRRDESQFTPIIITPHRNKEGFRISATPLKVFKSSHQNNNNNNNTTTIIETTTFAPPPPPPAPPAPPLDLAPKTYKLNITKKPTENQVNKKPNEIKLVIDANAIKSVKLKSSSLRPNLAPKQKTNVPSLSDITSIKLRKRVIVDKNQNENKENVSSPKKVNPFEFKLKKTDSVVRSPGGTPFRQFVVQKTQDSNISVPSFPNLEN